MRKGVLLLLILILVLTTSCSQSTNLNKTQTSQLKTTNDTKKTEVIENKKNIIIKISKKIHPTMPKYLFTIYGQKKDSLTYTANKIVISKLSGKKEKIIQTINFVETETPDFESLGFIIEDMNFDGYKDIRIQQFIPASPNVPFYCWLWNKDSSRYIENKDLEEISSLEVDNKKKIITSFFRDGSTYYDQTFKYINGRPTRFKYIERENDSERNVAHITIWKAVKVYDEPLDSK